MKDETLLTEKMTADYAWGNLGVPAEDCSAWADGWNARAALQSGNSAQPETYKLPPNSFTDDELMGMAHGDNPVANAYRELLEFRRNAAGGNSAQPVTVPAGFNALAVDNGLLAETDGIMVGFTGCDIAEKAWNAAIQHSNRWISVSERMPEPGRWLALYGAPVFTRGNDAGKPWHEFTVDEGYLDKEDGKFYLFNWESPGQIGDSYNNLLATATHWMYWELPDAPKVTP